MYPTECFALILPMKLTGYQNKVTNSLYMSCLSINCLQFNLMTDSDCYVNQMCRNIEGEKGVTSDVGVDCGSMKTSGISIFPCDKDILVSFATTSGRFAYSTDASGSPYIRKLTQVPLHIF